MCRKSHLRGWCTVTFGLGLLIGHCLESWFFCCCGGMALILFGFCIIGKR